MEEKGRRGSLGVASCVLLIIMITQTEGHIASFVSVEGKLGMPQPVRRDDAGVWQKDSSWRSSMEEQAYDLAEKPFLPLISPRSLSNVQSYFGDLRNNLEALQSSEEEAYESSEDEVGSNRNVLLSGGHPPLNHFPNAFLARRRTSQFNPRLTGQRPFVDSSSESFVIRRVPLPSHNYSPSWSFTGLGLGRKRRSVRGRN